MSSINNLKATNRVTGEIIEVTVNPNDPDELGNVWLDIQATIKELEELKNQVKFLADECMAKNDYQPIQLNNGHDWVRKAPVRKEYNFSVVRNYIDEDLMLTYTDKKGTSLVKVQSGPLKELVSQMVADKEIDTDAWQKLEDSAEIKAVEPYVQLVKQVR